MDVINGFVDYIQELFIKFLAKLPSTSFDYDSYVSGLNSVLGYVNWFLPIYLFKNIFAAWLVGFTACFTIFLIVKFIRKGINE